MKARIAVQFTCMCGVDARIGTELHVEEINEREIDH
jgi:hypothetical protein